MATEVHGDAPSTPGYTFQRRPSVSSISSVSPRSSGHFGAEGHGLSSSHKSSKYSSKEKLTPPQVNVDAPSTSGNQFQRRPSVPSSSAGHFGSEKRGLMSSRKSSKYSSKESLTTIPVNVDAPSRSRNQFQRKPSVSSSSSGHFGGEDICLKKSFDMSSNKHKASISSASKHEEKEPEQPLSGKSSVSRRGSVSSRHQHQQSQAENGASLRNPSLSLRDWENRSSCSSTSSGTSNPTLSNCFDKAVDALRKSITFMKSYAKPKRSMTYSDSSDSRTSRTSSVSSISNPGKSSSASNASRASSISHSSILKEKSFLSVNQPTSGASSDSEAGKSSSTGKAGKARSTSYSSKRGDSFLSVNQPTSGGSSNSEAGKSSSTSKAGKATSTSYGSKRK